MQGVAFWQHPGAKIISHIIWGCQWPHGNFFAYANAFLLLAKFSNARIIFYMDTANNKQMAPRYGSAEWFRQLDAECERQDAARREREYWERMDNMSDREWKRMERAE